jgi:hypothetical protein
VSGHKLRKEKNCLNCNAEVSARYCSYCGQENIEPEESFWQLCIHFVADLFHYDGKFFRTIRYLLLKPAFVTREYIRGRRASYLHPIRLYIFTSAVFFIVFFNFIVKHNKEEKAAPVEEKAALVSKLNKLKAQIGKELSSQKNTDSIKHLTTAYGLLEKFIDSVSTHDYVLTGDELNTLSERLLLMPHVPSSLSNWSDSLLKPLSEEADLSSDIFSLVEKSHSVEDYEKQQAGLSKDKRDNWFKTWLTKKLIPVKHYYNKDPKAFKSHLVEEFLHSIPKLLFISLPFVALIFQGLYLRKKHKHYTYVHHGVFTLHIYIMIFNLLFVYYGIDALHHLTHWQIFDWMSHIILAAIFFHLYKSMRNFYGQSRLITLIKLCLILCMNTFIMSVLMIVFFLNSVLNVN